MGRTFLAQLLPGRCRKGFSIGRRSSRAVPHLLLRVPFIHPAVRRLVRHLRGAQGTLALVFQCRSRRGLENPRRERAAERDILQVPRGGPGDCAEHSFWACGEEGSRPGHASPCGVEHERLVTVWSRVAYGTRSGAPSCAGEVGRLGA